MTAVVRQRSGKRRTSLLWFVRMSRMVASLVPFRVASVLGGMLGFAAYAALRRERRRAAEGLRTAFPGKDQEWIRSTVRRSFVHLGRALLEALAVRPSKIGQVVQVQGFDRIREALEQGRGAIYVAGHIGNWELMAGAVGQAFPISVIAAPLKPEPLNDIIVSLRKGMGVRTIIRGRPGAVREMIRIFRENGLLGILIDQDTDVEGAFVDFFGREAWTPTAAAQIALRFNAPVFFGYTHRESGGRHQVIVDGPIEMTRSGNDERDIVANTAVLTKRIEQAIRRDPVQWVWMHRRWRRRP